MSFLRMVWMLVLLGLLTSCNPGREQIHIPDPAFVTALIANGVDKNADLQISREEAEEVTDLEVSGFGIKDLTGLQEFIRLVSFHCLDNRLTKLDVSQNSDIELLNCHNNDLSQLDVSQKPELDNSVNTQKEFLLLEECPYLEEICVWTLPFPPAGTEALIVNCPSSYLTMDCTH